MENIDEIFDGILAKTYVPTKTFEWKISHIGNWTIGTVTVEGIVREFQVKHYDEPSEFGINGGKISKLWVREVGAAVPDLNYDRGWDGSLSPEGKSEDILAIYNSLLEQFN